MMLQHSPTLVTGWWGFTTMVSSADGMLQDSQKPRHALVVMWNSTQSGMLILRVWPGGSQGEDDSEELEPQRRAAPKHAALLTDSVASGALPAAVAEVRDDVLQAQADEHHPGEAGSHDTRRQHRPDAPPAAESLCGWQLAGTCVGVRRARGAGRKPQWNRNMGTGRFELSAKTTFAPGTGRPTYLSPACASYCAGRWTIGLCLGIAPKTS